jgi:undecaprenyl-diphosphatase
MSGNDEHHGRAMSLAGPVGAATDKSSVTLLRRWLALWAAWLSAIATRQRVRGRMPRTTRAARVVSVLVLAAAVVAVLMAFADPRFVDADRSLTPGVHAVMSAVTNAGRSGWLLVPVGVAVLALSAMAAAPGLTRASQFVIATLAARFGFVFLAVGIPGLTVTIVKRLIGRARPYVPHSTPFDYAPFTWRPDFASMPSGHTTTACATAIAIGALFPVLRPLLWLFAVLVAVSRVALNDHYPSDLFVATLAGIFGAILVRNWFATRRIVFVVAADGEVRPTPGPPPRRVRAALRQVFARAG